MRNYKQLSQEQRYQIKILITAGKNQKEIAELLCISG
ncbi:MAG: helix-turn-helix domain-containing protein, partial [Methylobacter tundripaludum]|nr:helix-turn-helix domain-containing protein [Methylobacter tundripaludum]